MKYQQTLLSDLFEIGSSKRVLKSQWRASGIPFYRGREVTKLSEDGYVENELFIDPDHFEQLASKSGVPSKGDIIITAIGTIGNTYIVKENDKFYFKDASVLWLKKKSQIVTEYINWWFKSSSMKSQLDEGNGATVDTLTIKKLQSLIVPVPPIDEQKRIVAMLDEAFADIEKARELAEQNLKNTRELFESYLHHQLTPHNDWCVSTLGEVSEISYGYTDSASYEVSGPKFLRITDIKGGSVDWDSVPLCQISSEDYNKHKLKSGDIVFARTGATTGKSYLVENPPEAVAASYLIRVRLDQERVNPRYVRYFFETRNYWDSVNAGTSGSAQGGFNASKLANLEIYFPTELDTQDVLIEKLEIISRMIEDVNKVYLEKLKNLNELKSGLFSKVFSRG